MNFCENCDRCCGSNKKDEMNQFRVKLFDEDYKLGHYQPIMTEGNDTCSKTGIKCKFAINGLCSVYDKRPYVCRWYPFYPINKPNGKIGLGLAVAPYCNYGNSVLKGIFDQDPEIINLSRKVFSEMKNTLSDTEINNWASRNYAAYSVIIEVKV